MITHVKILQIIPATGWRAVYFNRAGKLYTKDVVCWALVENPDGGSREVIGLEAEIYYMTPGQPPLGIGVEIDEGGPVVPWFLGYCGPTQDLSDFDSDAAKGAAEWQKYLDGLDAKRRAAEEERARQEELHVQDARRRIRIRTKEIEQNEDEEHSV